MKGVGARRQQFNFTIVLVSDGLIELVKSNIMRQTAEMEAGSLVKRSDRGFSCE